MEEYQKLQTMRIELLTTESSLRKIEYLVYNEQDLITRISNKILASYLNITPETYSKNLKEAILNIESK